MVCMFQDVEYIRFFCTFLLQGRPGRCDNRDLHEILVKTGSSLPGVRHLSHLQIAPPPRPWIQPKIFEISRCWTNSFFRTFLLQCRPGRGAIRDLREILVRTGPGTVYTLARPAEERRSTVGGVRLVQKHNTWRKSSVCHQIVENRPNRSS